MTHCSVRLVRKSESGAVAVEAAVCIAFILVPVLAFVLLSGRFFWYYTVAQKAVHDAALSMASATSLEIKSSRGAAGLANDIIMSETSDLDAETSSTLGITVLCGYKDQFSSDPQFFNCYASTTPPMAVRTGLTMTVSDPFFSPITNSVFGADGISIRTGATTTYVGR